MINKNYMNEWRVGPLYWLVYYYKGEIKVAKGYHDGGGYPYSKGRFTLADKDKCMFKIPFFCMEVSPNGRVLVRKEEDIPKAKELIREHYKNKLDTIKRQKDIAIRNITNL